MLTIDNETAFESFKTALAAVGGNYARLKAIANMGESFLCFELFHVCDVMVCSELSTLHVVFA